MSATALPDLETQQQAQDASARPASMDPTKDAPSRGTPEQKQQESGLSQDAKKELLNIRRDYKLSWTPNRRAISQRVLKAFEVLKGNAYPSFDPDSFQWYDAITAAAGSGGQVDSEFYKFNNNIYQMLALSFIAALSPQVPKTRYMPEDADDETDISTARRASTMMAIIERKNNIQSLQKQELLHLWTGGVYFSYSRYVVDGDRFKTSKVPIIQPVETEVVPDRFECPECGTATPANTFGAWNRPVCPKCGYAMGGEDFHECETMPLPTEVGQEDVPNGMVQISVFGALNIDAAPYATDLLETPILDLEVETDIAAVRASYPEAWEQLPSTMGHNSAPEGEADRLARIQMTSASGARSGYLSNSLTTYSRCWIQSWAFNHVNDKKLADELKAKFPNGCKLVTAGGEFLEAVPAKMTDEWTWCGTVRGMGLYPFAVGDAALDVQDRINDVANTVHEHMDRTASPTILVDEDAIDGEKMAGNAMPPGQLTLIKRKGPLAAKSLADIMFQPKFEIDAHIYSYGESLIQLAQLVSGVRPEIFGGSDKNVQTAAGQSQMLNQAIGRLALFWDQIREEHASRSENAVRCFAQNMPEKLRNVIEGDTDSGFENEWVLLSEMQGSFSAFPEADQGFPSTWAEIRDRLMQMLADANNPFVDEFLKDPENMKIVARYVAPPDIKIPGDAERTKTKRVISELAKHEPLEVSEQDAAGLGVVTSLPVLYLPQTDTGLCLPDKDFDDMGLIVDLCRQWGQRNWKMRDTNPAGYENVRAYLRIAAQFQQEQAVMPAVAAAQAAAAQGTGPGAPGAQAPAPAQV